MVVGTEDLGSVAWVCPRDVLGELQGLCLFPPVNFLNIYMSSMALISGDQRVNKIGTYLNFFPLFLIFIYRTTKLPQTALKAVSAFVWCSQAPSCATWPQNHQVILCATHLSQDCFLPSTTSTTWQKGPFTQGMISLMFLWACNQHGSMQFAGTSE